MSPSYTERRDALFDQLPREVSTVLLAPSETLRYLTGLEMHQSERPLLLALHRDRTPAAVVPKLETGRVRETVGEAVSFFVYEDAADPAAGAKAAFSEYASAYGVDGPVAAEFRSTRLLEQDVIAAEVDPGQIVDAGEATSMLRSQKDRAEIDRLRRAAAIIDDVLAAVTPTISPGQTEREVAREIHRRVLESNADRLAVLIVASGPNSAKPHTNTGTREIQRGDPLIIDAGVVYEGYHSDITRTYLVGDESETIREMYECTREAAREARDAVEPGTALGAIDRTARERIAGAGFGEHFPHRVGHGIGLEGHEPPYLAGGNEATLKPGHAITVEPGVYVEDVGGVRVEDDVVVTEDGAEVLTTTPRDLRVL
jgi:Xaa-Pro dipeptidase